MCIVFVNPHNSTERYRWWGCISKVLGILKEVVHKKQCKQCLAQGKWVTHAACCNPDISSPSLPTGPCYIVWYLCEWSLPLLFFPFPCHYNFSWSLISRALINTKILIAFCFTARVFINLSRCGKCFLFHILPSTCLIHHLRVVFLEGIREKHLALCPIIIGKDRRPTG